MHSPEKRIILYPSFTRNPIYRVTGVPTDRFCRLNRPFREADPRISGVCEANSGVFLKLPTGIVQHTHRNTRLTGCFRTNGTVFQWVERRLQQDHCNTPGGIGRLMQTVTLEPRRQGYPK